MNMAKIGDRIELSDSQPAVDGFPMEDSAEAKYLGNTESWAALFEWLDGFREKAESLGIDIEK